MYFKFEVTTANGKLTIKEKKTKDKFDSIELLIYLLDMLDGGNPEVDNCLNLRVTREAI